MQVSKQNETNRSEPLALAFVLSSTPAMQIPSLAAPLLTLLALGATTARAAPLAGSHAPLSVPDAPLVKVQNSPPLAPAPKTHTYTRRARAHP
ncbi:hypothetical protein C8Q76DRAFT_799794 [Earliella scabrosa]|nr:hypothetical protein C8Q76DRAFT_799794 [Earliella scabrosa]